MKFEVIQEDIDAANAAVESHRDFLKIHQTCPVAQAVRRKLHAGEGNVSVGYDQITVRENHGLDPYIGYVFPKSVTNRILEWDTEKTMKPFTFTARKLF